MDTLTFFLLVIILILLIALSWIWPPNSPWAPWWRTKKKTARAAFKMINLGNKDVIYELGSGEATALIIASQEFGADGVGIEIEPFRCALSRFTVFRKGLGNKIKLVRGDFFKKDLSNATAVYVYLVPKTLNRLVPKLKKELKKGTPIISYKYEMNLTLKKYDEKNELRYYVI
jgi:predicted RNA methylase